MKDSLTEHLEKTLDRTGMAIACLVLFFSFAFILIVVAGIVGAMG